MSEQKQAASTDPNLERARAICAEFMRDPGIIKLTLAGGNDDAPMVRAVLRALTEGASQ